ncbi:MAG: thioredoxin domain-containing protein [Marinifilaceae bacterium]|jgi:thiol-disulfide isomerase/thioredoxin|nr:thioredoxin domain-containing protein [Marinifilaceae bacterium]
MKYKSFAFLFLVFCSVLSSAQDNQAIKFSHDSWSNILKQAKTQNKLIFVDCYTSWCGPCKMMARDVFTQNEVGQYFNSNFISVKLDMEKKPGVDLKKSLGVNAYPTLVFIDGNNIIVHKEVGAKTKDELLQMAKKVVESGGELSKYNKEYQLNKNKDYDFIKKYLEVLAKAYDKEKQEKVVRNYFSTIANNKLLDANNWNLFVSYVNTPDIECFEYLLNNRAIFYQKYTKEKVDRKIYILMMTKGRSLTITNGSAIKIDHVKLGLFKKYLNEKTIEKSDEIINYTLLNLYRTTDDWANYVNHIDMCINDNKIDKSSLSIYNYALPLNRIANLDKELAKKAAAWLQLAIEDKNVQKEFIPAFKKLQVELLN